MILLMTSDTFTGILQKKKKSVFLTYNETLQREHAKTGKPDDIFCIYKP